MGKTKNVTKSFSINEVESTEKIYDKHLCQIVI